MCVFALQCCASIYLELVKLDKVDIEVIDFGYSRDDVAVALVGEAEDKVRSYIDATRLGLGDCIYGTLEVVATINMGKSGVVDRLDAVLYGYVCAMRQFLQDIEYFGIYAVGACTYDKARDIGV